MVKRNKNKAMKAKKQTAPRSRAAVRARSNLDRQAQEYAALLADPCNAKLTTSVFPGASGAFVSRFETDYIIGSGATATGAALVFTPGYCGGGTLAAVANSVDAVTDTTGFNLTSVQAAPGASFLATTSQIRTVAACAEIYWPGTELNRSGIISLGLVDTPILTDFAAGNLATTSNLRGLCQHTERMPTEKATINWRPGDMDAASTSPTATTLGAGRQSILLVAAGMPAAVGIRVRLVVVAEWWPKAGTGFVSSVPQVRSNNSVEQVLHTLDATGNWLFNTYRKVQPYIGPAVRAVTYGAKALGPALLAA